mmetsp:Transcript_43145/g.123708  ORF Transcript_43145/g.123708 Transcript_43145/m.123708 type:complete len:240 (-) Transcript_43145:640-1359(-)
MDDKEDRLQKSAHDPNCPPVSRCLCSGDAGGCQRSTRIRGKPSSRGSGPWRSNTSPRTRALRHGARSPVDAVEALLRRVRVRQFRGVRDAGVSVCLWRLLAFRGHRAGDVQRPGLARPAVLAVRHDTPAPLSSRHLAGIAPAVHERQVVVAIRVSHLESPFAKRHPITNERPHDNLLRVLRPVPNEREHCRQRLCVLHHGLHGRVNCSNRLLEVHSWKRHDLVVDAPPPLTVLDGYLCD